VGDGSALASSSYPHIGTEMTPERWQEVKKLLDQALEHKPEERHAFLDAACSFDHALRAEIGALLAEEEFVNPKFLHVPPYLDISSEGRGLESPLSAG
jgi:hypothetical protein